MQTKLFSDKSFVVFSVCILQAIRIKMQLSIFILIHKSRISIFQLTVPAAYSFRQCIHRTERQFAAPLINMLSTIKLHFTFTAKDILQLLQLKSKYKFTIINSNYIILSCKAREDIVLQTQNKYVYCRTCDLASQSSIRNFAERFKKGKYIKLWFH